MNGGAGGTICFFFQLTCAEIISLVILTETPLKSYPNVGIIGIISLAILVHTYISFIVLNFVLFLGLNSHCAPLAYAVIPTPVREIAKKHDILFFSDC